MQTDENLLINDIQVDSIALDYLANIAKWAKFLGITGFVFSGLTLILAMTTIVGYLDSNGYYYASGNTEVMNPVVTTCFLLAIAVILFFTSFFTYRFATKMKVALQNTDQLTFNDALANLSKNYRFLGVVTIIYLVFIVLAILAGIFLASFRRY